MSKSKRSNHKITMVDDPNPAMSPEFYVFNWDAFILLQSDRSGRKTSAKLRQRGYSAETAERALDYARNWKG